MSETLAQDAASAVDSPLDLLLTQAALGAGPRSVPLGTPLRFARALASRPRRVLARAGALR
jgi:hypothetical protein